MTKKHHQQLPLSEKDSIGCMQGLICMFYFRHGRAAPKLLKDRKHGSHAGTVYSKEPNRERKPEDVTDSFSQDDSEKKAGMVTSDKLSIKVLMEEEMSMVHPSKKHLYPGVGKVEPEPVFRGNLEKNNKQKGKTCKVTSDHADDFRTSAVTENCGSHNGNPNHNMDALMVDEIDHQYAQKQRDIKNKGDPSPVWKCSDHRNKNNPHDEFDDQLNKKKHVLKKSHCDVTEVFRHEEPFYSNRKVCQSKESMNDLALPGMNTESFLKLLQDQDSLSVRRIRALQNAQAGKSSRSEFHMNLKGSDKSKGIQPSKGSDKFPGYDRIVVLKPTHAGNQNRLPPERRSGTEKHEIGTKRAASHFSLKEIKRKLKFATGESRKERQRITMDDVLHRIPRGCDDSGDVYKKDMESVRKSLQRRSTASIEHTALSSVTRRAKCAPNMEPGTVSKAGRHKKLNTSEGSHSLHSVTRFYQEARKHLAVHLNTGEANETMSAEQFPNTLGRLLSWSGHNLSYPRFSCGSDKEPGSPQEMISPPTRQITQEPATNIEIPQYMDGKDNGIHLLDTDEKSSEDLIPRETTKAIEAVDTICTEEIENSAACSESSSKESGFRRERCSEEASSLSSVLGPTEERQVISSSSSLPTSLVVRTSELPDTLMGTPERPSPLSVLDPFFLDDNRSPGKATEHFEDSVQPGEVHFDSATVISSDTEIKKGTGAEDNDINFQFVRALLRAAGLTSDKMSKRQHSSDLLLDQFLFDEVAVSFSYLPADPELLFDFSNKVLADIEDRHFGSTPWLYIIRPDLRPAPMGRSLVEEVCKEFDRHFHLQHVLMQEQMIAKDLYCEDWMKLQHETEDIVFAVGDVILGYLMEETILELWD